MTEKHHRITREENTIRVMIRIYCRNKHATRGSLCPECEGLQDYAMKRLEKCPFQERKTTCANCPVHCYKPEMREKVRDVMRYSGPKMIYRHPVLAIFHILDGIKSKRKKQ